MSKLGEFVEHAQIDTVEAYRRTGKQAQLPSENECPQAYAARREIRKQRRLTEPPRPVDQAGAEHGSGL